MSAFDRQIDSNGETLADRVADDVEAADFHLIQVVGYLDLIAECLVSIAWEGARDGGRRQSKLEELRRGRH